MAIGHDATAAIGTALRSVRAGDHKLLSSVLATVAQRTVEVSSPAFPDGGRLPGSATIEGEGAPPAIRWSGVPAQAQSLALACEDPDAPLPRPYVHWLVWGIPATVTRLDPWELDGLREGKNSTMRRGYAPAAPPRGHGLHHYHFQVFALDEPLDVGEGAGRSSLLHAMRGHVVAWGETVGVYERR
ncbi:MAG TPA: YbhB/YbcL family Raf kinase inhibitor-like protein [Polyangiaceae bacterium]